MILACSIEYTLELGIKKRPGSKTGRFNNNQIITFPTWLSQLLQLSFHRPFRLVSDLPIP
jgi:hypothetical protein